MGRRALIRAAGRAAAAFHLGVALGAAALLAGCALHPPEVLRATCQQNLIHDTERSLTYPALSLFVQVDDPDGLEDLQDLYLINDRQELYWALDPGTWTRAQQDGGTWIGSNSLALPDGKPLPEGEYRLLLLDLAGEAGEGSVWVRAAAQPPAGLSPPRVVTAGGTIRLEDARTARPMRDAWTLWLYGADGRFRASAEYRAGGLPVSELTSTYPDLAAGFRFRLYRAPGPEGWGLISGPWTFTP